MRLRSARLDFIFGIASSFRCEDHRHIPALKFRFLLDLPDVLQLTHHPIQPSFIGGSDRFIDRQHAQLVAVIRNYTHRTDTDLPIHTGAWRFATLNWWQVSVLLR